MKAKKYIFPALAILLTAAVFIWSFMNEKESVYEKQSFAMGSPVKVTVYDEKDCENSVSSALTAVTELDAKYLSSTLDSSLAFKLNSERQIEADSFFADYLKKCLALSAECEKFTLLSGQLKALWKIEDGGYIPSDEEIAKILSDTDDESIKINDSTVSLNGGSLLDFGALGKGTACQTAIEKLKAGDIKNAVCTVGGTVGVIGSPKSGEKFKIAVRNPFGSQTDTIGTLTVTDCYISTSGDYEKFFTVDGIRYCHILDAETGSPVRGDITSVTVIANDGTVSDFLSTAVFILGDVDGVKLAEKYGAQVIIVYKNKTIRTYNGAESVFTLTSEDFIMS